MAKLHDVNSGDLHAAVALGCQTMSSVFNPDDNMVPYFSARLRPTADLGFHPEHTEAHVPGRHLNALLRAENVVGLAVPDDVIRHHEDALFFSLSGDVFLPLNRVRPDGPLVNFVAHNIREALHGLYALARFRSSDRARAAISTLIGEVRANWSPDAGWSLPESSAYFASNRLVSGLGRAIGPLVKIARDLQVEGSLELAIDVADALTQQGAFTPDGAYADELGMHVHSITSTLSSLAQLADLTNDRALKDRVRAFYQNGLWQLRDEIGWVREEVRVDAIADRGEINSTGDLVETALLLGRWGDAAAYADAEAILRGHLLPAQLRDTSFADQATPSSGSDARRDVPRRLKGAFGFPAPYGHLPIGQTALEFNLDIVGGAVASICEAISAAVDRTEGELGGVPRYRVNLMFDLSRPDIEIRSPYRDDLLVVVLSTPGRLEVRLPPWGHAMAAVRPELLRRARSTGGYYVLDRAPAGPIEFCVPLAQRSMSLEHRGRAIGVELRGDNVLRMESFGADLTFFDPL